MSDIRAIDNQTLAITVSDALRRHVGPRRRFSYEEAASAVGVKVRTMTSWVLGQTPPQSHKLVRLMAWLGERFANDVLALADLHTAPIKAGEGCAFEANKHLADALFVVAGALADGRMDHTEEPEVVAAMKNLAAFLPGFIAAHEPRLRAVAAE